MPIVGMPDGTQVQFPDDMPPERIKGLIAQKFPDEVKGAAQPQQETALSAAAKPVTDFPSTYREMRQESGVQLDRGIERFAKGFSEPEGKRVGPFPGPGANLDAAVADTALGAAGFITSPINAALRTVVGSPVEKTTGLPKEYTEFAAGMALPIPKKIPLPARAEPKVAPRGAPSTEALFEAADEGYAAARASKFQMAPEATANLKAGIQTELTDAGYRDFLTPKTFRAINEFKVDGPSNVADVEAVRRALNIAAKDPAEKDAARRAIAAIDTKMGAEVPELAAARGNYAAGSRAEALEEATEKAQRQAGSANSGQNIDNATRQQFKAILNSPAKRRGYSANELAQMEVIVQGSKAGDAARFAGNLLGGGGGLGSVVTAGAGGLAVGPAGVLAPIFGYGFKKLGNALTQGQVAKLDEMVRARSPLGQSVGSSTKSWSEASQAFELDPSVKNFVRLSVASRNLSNNLKAADISVAPNDLLRSLQGPMPGRAEGEQQ